MTKRVLVIGGTGHIGHYIAKDIQQQTQADVTITGRNFSLTQDFSFLQLDLNNSEKIREIISEFDLVVHGAGPFHNRDGRVLKSCIEQGINYIDVSDHRSFHCQVASYHEKARQAGVTAVLHTGVFPGISNLMAREGIEALDKTDSIQLNYVVAGSGGAGLTVMRTTFLGLQSPFLAWIQGKWQDVLPYSKPEIVTFPHYGEASVYWFDVAETYTLAHSFPVETVVTKFGSLPNFYNDLTGMVAQRVPQSVLQNSLVMEGLSKLGLAMARVTDWLSGVGIAVCVDAKGWKAGKEQNYRLQFYHDHTAIAAGMGAGSIAQLLLDQEICQPGVWSVEQVATTSLFRKMMKQRGINIDSFSVS